jgi:amino acid permease
MISINKNPSKSELRWFGVLALAFFGLMGLSLLHKTHSLRASEYLWTFAVVFLVTYYVLPSIRKPIYVGWMYAVYPIGWVVSHVLLAAAFFGVVVPVGLLMRAVARDPLARSFDPTAKSYWTEHDPGTDSDRYFRQF